MSVVLWMLFAAEDVGILDISFCNICSDSFREPEILGLSITATLCWIFKCCISGFHVCFSSTRNCKFITVSDIYFDPPDCRIPSHLCCFLYLPMQEFGDQNEKCWIHAILSLSCNILDESGFLCVWNVQAWCFHLCKFSLFPSFPLIYFVPMPTDLITIRVMTTEGPPILVSSNNYPSLLLIFFSWYRFRMELEQFWGLSNWPCTPIIAVLPERSWGIPW